MEDERREDRDEDEHEDDARERLVSLIVYTVSFSVICLSAFNFYLLVWIWSGLRDGRQLDLLSSWDEFKIEGLLVSRRPFEVNQIHPRNGKNLQIISDSSSSNSNNNNSIIEFQDSSSAETLEQSKTLMELSEQDGCRFASGLKVRGLSSGRVGLACGLAHRQTKLDDPNTRRSTNHECLLEGGNDVAVVQLSHSKGVDFRAKSVQTNRIKTKRLHSALNELHLMSSNESSFESFGGPIRVHSMDDLILASKRSNVSGKNSKSLSLSLTPLAFS